LPLSCAVRFSQPTRHQTFRRIDSALKLH
jgi:hypothetical protein